MFIIATLVNAASYFLLLKSENELSMGQILTSQLSYLIIPPFVVGLIYTLNFKEIMPRKIKFNIALIFFVIYILIILIALLIGSYSIPINISQFQIQKLKEALVPSLTVCLLYLIILAIFTYLFLDLGGRLYRLFV